MQEFQSRQRIVYYDIFDIYWGETMRISCRCGNTETFSNRMGNFEIHFIKFSADSKTGVITVVCKACGQETEEILIGL